MTYTLRVSTGEGRDDELSEPDAPLVVSFITADGRAHLHRLPCAALAGVRGLPGGVDTLSVPAPQSLGAPARIWLAPERGTWGVTSATVGVGEGTDALRFTGTGGPELRPAAPEVIRTPEQRQAQRQAGMKAYTSLKQRLVGVTAALSVIGGAAAQQLGGEHAALPFLVGAAAGIAYLALLERGVDSLKAGDEQSASSQDGAAQGTGAASRLAFVIVLAVVAAHLFADRAGGDPASLRIELASGALGFLTYKVAVLAVGLLSQDEETDRDEER